MMKEFHPFPQGVGMCLPMRVVCDTGVRYISYLMQSIVSPASYIEYVKSGNQKETTTLPLMILQQEN